MVCFGQDDDKFIPTFAAIAAHQVAVAQHGADARSNFLDHFIANVVAVLVVDELKTKYPSAPEMEKVKNKFESSSIFANTSILNKAINLSFYELIGNTDLINNEVGLYRKVSRDMVIEAAGRYFEPGNCSTLYYRSTGAGK